MIWQRALEVAPGDPITSTQLVKFAQAFNDRLPYFDFAWRIAYWYHSLFRAVRNGSADGSLQAPWPEYHYSYQGLEPGQGDWPINGPGEPEGFNLSNPLGAYIWGNAGADLWDESGRLSDVWITNPDGTQPVTARERWDLRKLQCGAVNLATGEATTPAYTAARSWYLTYGGPRSPHGNSYGGFMPSPAVLGVCDDPDLLDGFPPPYNEEVLFTATAAGVAAGYADKVYAGSCPIGPSTVADYSLHVWGIWRTPWAFYVLLNNGTLDTLPRFAYVEGPYAGVPLLRKTEGGQLIRALAAFAASHRGIEQNDVARSATEESAAQKARSWLVGAFKNQEFFQAQYPIAPLRGGTSEDGSVVALPPSGAGLANGDGYVLIQTLLNHQVELGCVVSYVFVEVLDGEEEFVEFAVEVNGQVTAFQLPKAEGSRLVKVSATAGQSVIVRLANHTKASRVNVELSEEIEYKPDISDLILLQRLVGDPENGFYLNCSTWLSEIVSQGCVLNRNAQEVVLTPPVAVTEHPAYEAIRRWSRCVRLLPAGSVVGYAVEDGKSIVWFKRYADWTGGNAGKTEIFEFGNSVQAGREYSVEGPVGAAYYIYYGSTQIFTGEHFIGLEGELDFTPYDAAVHVFEISPGILDPSAAGDNWSGIVERITRTAPKQGFTNRWFMGFQFRPRHPSQSSVWKEAAFGDIVGFNDRALFFSPEIANEINKRWLWHVAFGQRVPGDLGGNMIAEVPSGYRYAPVSTCAGSWAGKTHLNQIVVDGTRWVDDAMRDKFYKSCRIYEQDLEIESAEAVTENGQELVKVTMTGRFHSTYGEVDGALESIARDVDTWDLDDLQAQPYQCTERAIMTHVARLFTGRNFTATIGDNAANSYVQDMTDNPYATDYPMVYLVKGIPEPYVDTNDTQDVSDAPLFHDAITQAEGYLCAMCNSCVDHEQNLDRLLDATVANGGIPPAAWGLSDYDYQTLCNEAFGGAWAGLMPMVPTAYTPASRCRVDDPHGFGPLPNMNASAEVFNRLVKMVNLLDTFRVMLPWELERWKTEYYTDRDADYIQDAYPCNYPSGLSFAYSDREKFPVASTVINDDGAWSVDTAAEATHFGRLLATMASTWRIDCDRVDVRWRVHLADGIENALPPYVADLFDIDQVGLLCWTTSSYSNSKRTSAAPGDPGAYLDSGTGLWWYWPHGSVDVSESYAEFRNQGLATPPALPQPSDVGYFYDGIDPAGFSSPGGSESYLGIAPVAGETMFVRVPLTDD